MSLQTKVIGRQPTDHGPYDPNLAYGKKFQCTLFGCAWESLHDNNNTAPAVWDGGDTITPNLVDWKKVSGSYEAWLMNHDKPAASEQYPFNGMGRVRLQKNIVNGVNTLTQAMLTQQNTIYVIQYDFTLGEDITVPANCVLEFEGGSISGAYTLTGANTGINANLMKIFNTDVVLAGTWSVSEVFPEWFGAVGDGTVDSSDAIQVAMGFAQRCAAPLRFIHGTYRVTKTLDYRGCVINGYGQKEYEPKIIKDFNGHLFANLSGGVSRGLQIHNISFDGLGHSGSFYRCAEDETDRMSPVEISGCSFYNTITDPAIYLKHCYSGYISNCYFLSVNCGIEANNSVNCISVRDCNFLSIETCGIKVLQGCYTWQIDRNIFQAIPTAIILGGVSGCNINACYTEYIGDADHAVIEVNAADGVVISGCQMSGRGIDGQARIVKRAILLNGGLNIAIFGNRISDALCPSGVAPIYSNAEYVMAGDMYEIEDARSYPSATRVTPFITFGTEISDAGPHLIGLKAPRKEYSYSDYILDELTWDGKSWKKVGTYFGNALRASYPDVASLPAVSSVFTDSHYAYPGYRAFVQDIKRGVMFNGSKWVDEDGFTPKRKKGTTAQRPSIHVVDGAEDMYEYYDETVRKKIIMSVLYGEDIRITYVRAGNFDNYVGNPFEEGKDYTIRLQSLGNKVIAFAKNNTSTDLSDMIIIYQGSDASEIPFIAPSPSVYPYIYVKVHYQTTEDYKQLWYRTITCQWVDATGTPV